MRGTAIFLSLAGAAMVAAQPDGFEPVQRAVASSSLYARDNSLSCKDQYMKQCSDSGHCAPAGVVCCENSMTICQAGTRCMTDGNGNPGCCKAGHQCDTGIADVVASPAPTGAPPASSSSGAAPNSFGGGITVGGVTIKGGSGGGIYVGPDGSTTLTPITSTEDTNVNATTTMSSSHSQTRSVSTSNDSGSKDDKGKDGKSSAAMVNANILGLVGSVVAAVAAFL